MRGKAEKRFRERAKPRANFQHGEFGRPGSLCNCACSSFVRKKILPERPVGREAVRRKEGFDFGNGHGMLLFGLIR